MMKEEGGMHQQQQRRRRRSLVFQLDFGWQCFAFTTDRE